MRAAVRLPHNIFKPWRTPNFRSPLLFQRGFSSRVPNRLTGKYSFHKFPLFKPLMFGTGLSLYAISMTGFGASETKTTKLEGADLKYHETAIKFVQDREWTDIFKNPSNSETSLRDALGYVKYCVQNNSIPININDFEFEHLIEKLIILDLENEVKSKGDVSFVPKWLNIFDQVYGFKNLEINKLIIRHINDKLLYYIWEYKTLQFMLDRIDDKKIFIDVIESSDFLTPHLCKTLVKRLTGNKIKGLGAKYCNNYDMYLILKFHNVIHPSDAVDLFMNMAKRNSIDLIRKRNILDYLTTVNPDPSAKKEIISQLVIGTTQDFENEIIEGFFKLISEIDYVFNKTESDTLSRIIQGSLRELEKKCSKSGDKHDEKILERVKVNIDRIIKDNPKLGIKRID